MNSTFKAAAKIIDELRQSNKNNDMKHKGKIGRVLKGEMGKETNAWPVH
jgi:hypothetical protein